MQDSKWKKLGVIIVGLIIFLMIFGSAYADSEVSQTIDDLSDNGSDYFEELIGDSGLDGDNLLGTTEDEVQDVRTGAFDTLKAGKDFAFSFHHLFEAIALSVSPGDLDPTIVSLIALALSGLMVFMFVKKLWIHFIIFAMAIVVFAVVVMVVGINPEF
jgi:hypothetical protein